MPGGQHAAVSASTARSTNLSKSAFTILWSFGGSPDGSEPSGNVVVDDAGNVFGTTRNGGITNDGTVFKITVPKKGEKFTESILHSFNGADGTFPVGAIEDGSGNFFVSTFSGGSSNFGTVVELSPSSGVYAETGLFSFDYSDGAYPLGAPVEVENTLYMTTSGGGSSGPSGTISSLGISPSGLQDNDLYNFTGLADGNGPSAGLVADSSGALYGTTTYGGVNQEGVVFKFVPKPSGGGTETVLWSFGAPNGGALPRSGVVLDASGNIYGTTFYTSGSAQNPTGNGVVFKLSQNGGTYNETVLHTFVGGITDGAGPLASPTLVGTMLYGTTSDGGVGKRKSGFGTIYQVSTAGTDYATIHSFVGTDGSDQVGSLTAAGSFLYGTAVAGGASKHGVVFRLPI
jgi:uncharacterized repeat protein (TIGR03803 family)